LECDHEFHARCIDRWLTLKPECPLCRRNILSLAEETFYFSAGIGFCVGSVAVMINHLDNPIRGLFKTTCFGLSYILAVTGAAQARLGRVQQHTNALTYFKLSGAFAVAYTLI